jgi:HlyD family secretion protein
MSKFKVSLIISIIVLGIVLLVAYRLKEKNESQASLGKPKNQKIPVTVITPKKGYFSSTLTVSGTVLPKEEVEVTPKANGKLLSLLVEEGASVKAGQVIGTIDHSELDAQVEQAEAQARIARANLSMSVNGPLQPQVVQARTLINQGEANLKQLEASRANIERDLASYEALLSKGIIPAQQVNNTRMQLEIARQQIAAARQQMESSRQSLKLLTDGTRPEQIEVNRGQLDNALATIKFYRSQLADYNILSPINGVITKKFLSGGSLVNQNTPIVTVSKDSDPEIVMNVPEKEIENIRVGQKVDIKTSGSSDKVYPGVIKEVYPNIDNQTRMAKVKAQFISKEPLKLGMLLVCNIYTVEKQNTLVLPTDAVIKEKDKIYVYTVNANKAVKKAVTLGIEEPDETEVISGIQPTEKVILKGNTFVKPGSAIEVHSESRIKRIK